MQRFFDPSSTRLANHLKDGAVIGGAAEFGGAVEVTGRIHDQAGNEIGCVARWTETVEHRHAPSAAGFLPHLKHTSAVAGAATGGCAIKVSCLVGNEARTRVGRIPVIFVEVVKDGPGL